MELSERQRDEIRRTLRHYIGAHADIVANGLAPVVARMIADAEKRGYDTAATDLSSIRETHYRRGKRAGAAEQAAKVEALAAEWETAADEPMPKRAPTESAQDQGVRIGVWHSVRVAAGELRAALASEGTDALAKVRADALRAAGAWLAQQRNGATGRRLTNAEMFGQMIHARGDEIEHQAERRARADRIERGDSNE